MKHMITLDKAISLATDLHTGQVDKSGRPYILHPLRVMHRVDGDDDAMIVAVLHDVFEDTEFTFEDFAKYEAPEHIVEALKAITRPKANTPNRPTYREYIYALKDNDLARTVKVADLLDNMSPERWENLPESMHSLLDRYEWSISFLMDEYDEDDDTRDMGEHPPLRLVPRLR